jgi:hypothetical protein
VVELDPSKWSPDFHVEVEVGFGAGAAREQIDNMMQLLTIQERMASVGLSHMVSEKNVYNATTKLSEAMGYTNPLLFFTDPDLVEKPPPPPDPEMKKLELEALKEEADKEIRGGELQLKAMTQQDLQQYRMMEIASKEKLERERLATQERIALGQQEVTLEAAKISSESNEGDEDDGREDNAE